MFDVDNAVDFDETANLSVWQKDVDTLLRKNKCGDALDVAENQLAVYKGDKDAAGTAAAQNAVARCHFSARSYDKALTAANQALSTAQSANATAEEAAILHTLAKVQMYSQQLDDAESSVELALEKYIDSSNRTGEAAVTLTSGCLKLLQGQVTEAFESTEKAMEIYEELGEISGKVSVLHTQMAVFGILSRYPEAFELSMQSAGLLRQTDDKYRLAAVLLMSADMAVPAGEIDEGLKNVKEALTLFEKFEDGPGKATALCTITKGYLADKRWANAISNADEACDAAKTCSKKDLAAAFSLAATVRRQKAGHGTEEWPPKRGIPEEDLSELHECAEKAVSFSKEAKDEPLEAASQQELAYSCLANGNPTKALEALSRALTLFENMNDKMGEGNAIYTIAQVKFGKGDRAGGVNDMQRAIAHFKEHKIDAAVKLAERVLASMNKAPQAYGYSAYRELVKPVGPQKAAGVGLGEDAGGISPAQYTLFIHRSMTLGKSHGEHIFENPMQVIGLQMMLGIKFPFWRGQEGKDHPNIAPKGDEKASGKRKKAPKADGEEGDDSLDVGRGMSSLRAVDFQAQVSKVKSELEKEAPKPPPGGSVVGDDLLGGRHFDCPEDLHEEMLGLASSSDIGVTTPAQRKENMEKRPTFYGSPALRDAVRWGYIHPSMPAPAGMTWKQVRPGAYKLKPQ